MSLWTTFIRVRFDAIAQLLANAKLAQRFVDDRAGVRRGLGVMARDFAGADFTSLRVHDPAWDRRVCAELVAEGLDPDERILGIHPFTRAPTPLLRRHLTPSRDRDLARDLGASGVIPADGGFGPAVYLEPAGVSALPELQGGVAPELDALVGRAIERRDFMIVYVS